MNRMINDKWNSRALTHPNSTSSSIRRLLIKFSVRFLMRQRSDISSILDESMRGQK